MIDWIIIVVAVLFSALFSGLEIAFVTADKMQMEIINKRGGRIANILSSFTKSPSRFIATLLIGNNLALVTFSLYIEGIIKGKIDFTNNTLIILIIETIISTFIVLIFAEYLPKTLFRLKPNHALRFFAYPMYALFWLMKWVVELIVHFSKFLLTKFSSVEFSEDRQIFGRSELREYLTERTENAENTEGIDSEVQYYKNVLDFNSVKVRDCMVPRTEIIALDVQSPIEKLRNTFIETQHSKILIYKDDNIDDIIGFVHSKAIFNQPKDIKSIMLPVGYIPESMNASRALNNFLQLRKSVLIVVDEFGGTSGMLTVEDVLEEILGEIEDEHDQTDFTEDQISPTEFLFSGRLEIDYINEKYNLQIPTDESYETLAGFIFSFSESIPDEGETIYIEPFQMVIEKVGETRIDLVKLISPEPLSNN